ncbi:GNAT domain-containing protein [Geopyxis carbonaria]|nr:GNAT domain-containing protein [Geopyxis carbonaria]
MLLNQKTALLSSQVLLIPYENHHVPIYHSWMEDEELLNATASQRLTLEEEYAMQKSWRFDPDKLTFIGCLPPSVPATKILAQDHDASNYLFGDVNLFLDGEIDPCTGKESIWGEVEIMVAVKAMQGKGLGRATLLLFLWYVLSNQSLVISARAATKDARLEFLRVKIHKDNGRSIRLFESVGFEKVTETPNFFQEFELVLRDLRTERIGSLLVHSGSNSWGELEYCSQA